MTACGRSSPRPGARAYPNRSSSAPSIRCSPPDAPADALHALPVRAEPPELALLLALVTALERALLAGRHLPRQGHPLLLPHDFDGHGLALVIRPEDAHRVGRRGRLPPADRQDHVAALQGQAV